MKDYIPWLLRSMQALIMVGACLATLIGVIVGVLPRLLEGVEIHGEIDALQVERDDLAEQVNELKQVDIADLKERMQVLLYLLPPEADMPHIVSSINQLADEHNLTITSVGASAQISDVDEVKKAKKAIVDSQKIVVTANATLADFIVFIQELEKLQPLIQVDGMEVAFAHDGEVLSEETVLTVDMRVVSYVQNEVQISDDVTSKNIVSSVPVLRAEDERLYIELSERRKFDFIPATGSAGFLRIDPFQLD